MASITFTRDGGLMVDLRKELATGNCTRVSLDDNLQSQAGGACHHTLFDIAQCFLHKPVTLL